ncbi:MAG TPA: hypothetical protein VIA18_09945, partial [Polyangia bacterium]|nr:hypothetical protein [Polyangia bacterium]
MKPEPNPNEREQPPAPRRNPDDGETTIFWRPSLPLVAIGPPSRRHAYADGAGLFVAILGSLAGVVGWARASSTQETTNARAPIRLAPIALVAASSSGDELAAVLEAVEITSVRAGDDNAGTVRRAVARGTPVTRGSPLVTVHRADPEPARRLAELDALLEQYDDASPTAPALERARAAYERAVAESRDAAVVRAPVAGIVVGVPPRVGEVVAGGAELARV